ncbi:CheW-like domain protein [Leptolyngbya boryana NIES-2135]|jgi:two-component system chemotaxis sensor kinase CheA|uniref:histidine kinase n=1 Tax=Leptolyngbya boryana NIES-2135 TaxID=1973484 RepID=A0A1Z4JLR5_LEPBY|nr:MULTISPECIES: chemotaxis protein CheA [Leptolyngbya]BAY57689.1 CheW-like domain protein [Leptolyngbya boryana NIES-2135]MBD1858739.1 chemotaxis protein CheA [Leptolyngbya sp. FACHB-1624]MBD2367643.1 chemotaxis protein CheA [Leptolyngbya sp. FACHB-161]MBD2374167.1 chemotaxis protein CheA [Leptolyngbya sp. FACHB-238]MBD2398792.1 chemotaxis protein CheA [Leptolyngbya sp. FACHB-239]
MESLHEIDAEDLAAFLVESYEILNQFEQDVLDLERHALDPDRLNRLYRALHTIKGNCGFLPLPTLAAIAHAGETLLEGIRTAEFKMTPGVATVLLDLTDTIRQLLKTIETTKTEGTADYSRFITKLTVLYSSEHQAATRSGVLEDSDSTSLTTLDSTIRVQVDLLDQVMNLVGELVIARNRVLQLTTDSSDVALMATCRQIDLITNELQDSIMRARMQPINTLWRNLPRLVRELEIACGKEIALELEGSETELDRNIIAAIKDPLMHLVRNCIDHGIEPPEVRVAAGKSAQGSLKLRASQENGKVILEIREDGAGIDPAQLKARSQQLGLISAAQAESMRDREALDLIFIPGFSTLNEATHLSGRGVGMDVVRRNIESVNGSIEVESQVGQGTTFRLNIPLTLAIIPTLLVKSGGERFAIPQSSVQELIRIEGRDRIDQQIETLFDAPVYRLRGHILPLVNLATVLQLPMSSSDLLYFVVIDAESYRFGLIVDQIEDTQEIVVKPLSKQIKSLEVFAGATVLGDGSAALILDAVGVARYAGIQPSFNQIIAAEPTPENRQLILIVLGHHNTRMGIVLTQSTRLEMIASQKIEKVGEQYLMQYRDRVVALIDLQAVLSRIPRSSHEFEESIAVVVIEREHNQVIGLIVDQILDIVEESLTVTGAAIRPGSSCYASVQGQITEMLDLDAIVKLANPYLVSDESWR